MAMLCVLLDVALVQRFIRIIATVVFSVTEQAGGNTFAVRTVESLWGQTGTGFSLRTIGFVTAIATVKGTITDLNNAQQKQIKNNSY